jgi:hypothetical protein
MLGWGPSSRRSDRSWPRSGRMRSEQHRMNVAGYGSDTEVPLLGGLRRRETVFDVVHHLA